MLHDPIPLYILATFEEDIQNALKLSPELKTARSHLALFPSLLACVAEWHIEGFPEKPTVETFPGIGTGVSKKDVAELINLVTNNILKLFNGVDPNA